MNASGAETIRVETAQPYDVTVGRGVLATLPAVLDGLPSRPRRVALVHPEGVEPIAAEVRRALAAGDFAVCPLVVPDAEAAKTAEVATACWAALGQQGFTRTDVVVGLGGGATTDLAGFVAATWLRGVPLVQAPTSVLGMVDAAVGGKTGINTAEGKNLVGAFHEPSAVLCDLATLDSLPAQEYLPGLAEVVKCGFIADPAILEVVERAADRVVRPDTPEAREVIERSIRVKARVVAADLTETAALFGGGPGREVLNYGHTLGHAIERREAYLWRHGAAISVGLVFAAELARLAGRLDDATADRHRADLERLGLPTAYDPAAWPALLDGMRLDKKTRGNTLRFVVLDGLARPAILEGPETSLLEKAYARIAA